MPATRSCLLLRSLLVVLLASALVAHPTGSLAVSPSPVQAAPIILTDCQPSSLLNAVSMAMDGDSIQLAAGCTHTFTAASDYTYGPSALAITKTLTIEGNGAVLAASPPVTGLRLLMVGLTGNLTLWDAELRDSYVRGGPGGSGLQRGGAGLGARWSFWVA